MTTNNVIKNSHQLLKFSNQTSTVEDIKIHKQKNTCSCVNNNVLVSLAETPCYLSVNSQRSMENVQRSTENPALRSSTLRVDQLSLYNQFGSIAYGIILKIIPQERVAQEVLVDVFTSSQLPHLPATVNPLVSIVKVARAKALDAKQKLSNQPLLAELNYHPADITPETIFNLSFHQGYSVEEIALQFAMDKSEVLKAIREYVKSFRQ